MSLTQSCVFKLFRRDCNIVWLVKSFLHYEKYRVAYRCFGLGSWYVITSEIHWITMHKRNMYTHNIYTHTNMFEHVNSKNKMFYQYWKETDLCVHTNMFCSDHAILGFPLLRVPCQCSLVLSDLNSWFRASFLFILSCLLCLFWLESKTEEKIKKCWQLYVFKGKGRDGLSVIRHLDCASLLMHIAFVGPNVSVNADQECVYSCS